MGGGNYNMNSSQFDVLRDEPYKKSRGCFVTTPKAIIYVVIAFISLVLVALVMYYYGPYSSVVKTIENPMDIEKLLNYSVGNISQDIKLPTYVQPLSYKLKLDPILQETNSSLQGQVTIRLKCLQRTKKMVLNADKLNIISVQVSRIEAMKNRTKRSALEENGATQTTQSVAVTKPTESIAEKNNTLATVNSVSINDAAATTEISTTKAAVIETTTAGHGNKEGNKIPLDEIITTTDLNVTDRRYDSPNSKYIIQLKKDLDVRKQYVVNITFSANISDAFRGLYQLTYKDKTSLLVTQLQPIYARKLFPCFDEPAFKSPIQVTVRKHSNITILSNTPLVRSYRSDDQKTWDEFEETPPLPTYLFSFVVGNLKVIAEEKYKPLIRVWGLDNSNIMATEAIGFTKKIMERLEIYFDLPYPLKKIDIVAVRELRFTVASPGLAFIKETLFLPSTKSDADRKNKLFAELVKSLTKEWIGSLVSVTWWNDFWLINGFSIFMSEELHSVLGNEESDFTLQLSQETLQSDDLKSALSLRSEIENSIQIFDISDEIKNNKASCILRMLNHSLAPLTFKKGIQSFVKEWRENSTDVGHLWESLDLVVTKVDGLPEGKDVTDIMKSWTTQPAYPLVTVVRNVADGALNISQAKFRLETNKTDSNLWIIPISYVFGSDGDGEVRRFWLTEKTLQIDDATVKSFRSTWILVNVDRTGYYRVNYDLQNWGLLTNTLYTNHSKISPENRGQLINDAFELAEHGLLDYNIPFNLSRYLINETQYIPWASALESLESIKNILETTYLNGAFEDYITNLIGNIYDQTSAEIGQDSNKSKLKDLIVETACGVNYSNCTRWALEKLREWIENPNISIPNRKTALCTGIRLSGRKEWEVMYERLRSDDANSGIEDLYTALGCTKHLWLINRYLDSTLNGTIPSRYVSYVWQSIQHVTSRTFGLKFLRENWEKIYFIYEEKRLILKTIMQDFLYSLSTKSDKEDLTLFFGKNAKNLQGFSYILKGVVDRIDAKISWAEKYLKTIEIWLSSHEYK